MEKLLSEFYTSFKEKISSPFFRFFIISWTLWNYKFIYFIFFQDQEIFFKVHKITKFDYLINNPFFYETWYYSIFICFILPILSTLFFIYIFPRYNKKILIKYIRDLNEEFDEKQERRKKIKLGDLEISQIKLEEKINETAVNKLDKLLKEGEENTKYSEWKKEYKDFKKTESYNIFDRVIEIINFHNGNFKSKNINYIIDNNTISHMLANNIINKHETITHYNQFTEKGKYFAKLYFEEKSI